MKILVVGAAGKTGKAVVEQALAVQASATATASTLAAP